MFDNPIGNIDRFVDRTFGSLQSAAVSAPVSAPVSAGTSSSMVRINPGFGSSLMGNLGSAVSAARDISSYRDALGRAYDAQRVNVRRQGELNAEDLQDEAAARLAGRGISEDSGLYQKQLQKARLAASHDTANQIGQLNISQLNTENSQGFQRDLAMLNNSFAEGRIRLQDALNDQNAADKAVSDSYYARGQAGEEIPSADLEALRISNPTAYYAYMNGKAGKTQEENDADLQNRIDYRNALITGIDINDPDFIKKLNDAFSAGLPTPGSNSSNENNTPDNNSNQDNSPDNVPEEGDFYYDDASDTFKRYTRDGGWSDWDAPSNMKYIYVVQARRDRGEIPTDEEIRRARQERDIIRFSTSMSNLNQDYIDLDALFPGLTTYLDQYNG